LCLELRDPRGSDRAREPLVAAEPGAVAAVARPWAFGEVLSVECPQLQPRRTIVRLYAVMTADPGRCAAVQVTGAERRRRCRQRRGVIPKTS